MYKDFCSYIIFFKIHGSIIPNKHENIGFDVNGGFEILTKDGCRHQLFFDGTDCEIEINFTIFQYQSQIYTGVFLRDRFSFTGVAVVNWKYGRVKSVATKPK